MKVITGGGAVIDIGTVEAAPTIGIIDYSRRETDVFGVTTVVPRSFARLMSVRVKVATNRVDDLQRQLAALRATPATWIADERFDSLRIEGFYKDFSIDLAIPPVSYCTLTIEGLAEDGGFVDPGTDPAPDHRPSTLRLLQPLDVSDAVLTSSSVPEIDYAAWSAGVTYALGARVIKAATHRIYESAAAGNADNDPTGASALWIDIGPTNRWAMFDQALGSLTSASGVITVVLTPPQAINAVALLDVIAASVRVQAGAYDRTQGPSAAPGMVTFLDIPAGVGPVTVTITGAGAVSVGTLLIGSLVGLGVTEAAPTAAITDYSRKETDGFGETTLVERAWAKRMNVRGLIDTTAVDIVAGRIAAVRARPSLWIGDDSLESVTVYGFFKDFSIEVGDSVSFLTLSIEGLSKAAKIAPIMPAPGWTDIVDDDPDRPKPDDGATVGAPPGTNVGDTPAETVAAALKAVGLSTDPAEVVAGAQALADAVKELALTVNPGEIVAGAKSLVDRARRADMATLEQILINEERKERFDRLTHMDGAPVSVRVRTETIERITGDEALAMRSTLIEATMTENQLAAIAAIEQEAIARATADAAEASIRTTMIAQVTLTVDANRTEALAAIEEEAIARADAIAAETVQRELAISTFQAVVDGQIADVSAAIASEATTRATADAAETATRTAQVATLTAGLSDANAAITTEATTRAAADIAETTARTLAISTLSTQVDGQIANVSAAIASEATTRATADAAETAARQAAISTLTTGLSDANAAITAEALTRAAADVAETTTRTAQVATLTNGLADANAAITAEATTRAAADIAETTARNVAISNLNTSLGGQINDVSAALVSEATTRATADAAETTARQGAISTLTTNLNGEISARQAAIVSEAATRATAISAETTAREAAISSLQTATGNAITAAIVSEASTRATAISAETAARETALSSLNTDIRAYVAGEVTTLVAADTAMAASIIDVSTTLNGQTASVALLLESVDGLNAQMVARVETDGVIGGFQLAGGGGVVDANFLVDNFRLLSRSSGDKWEYSDGRQRTIGGSIMTVVGVPFGSSSQFIEWTGPIVSNLALCTEANAIKYVKTDGSAYFGGGLSSGILKNEATSTVVAADAFVTVGPFSSNGGPVNVNMSAVYAWHQLADAGTASISGSGSGELVLRWSSDGATWNYLTAIGASEYQREVVVDGDPTVKDQISWEARGASTFTWTPGALNGIYISLSWTARTTPSFGGTGMTFPNLIQRTTIIAVEQP